MKEAPAYRAGTAPAALKAGRATLDSISMAGKKRRRVERFQRPECLRGEALIESEVSSGTSA